MYRMETSAFRVFRFSCPALPCCPPASLPGIVTETCTYSLSQELYLQCLMEPSPQLGSGQRGRGWISSAHFLHTDLEILRYFLMSHNEQQQS